MSGRPQDQGRPETSAPTDHGRRTAEQQPRLASTSRDGPPVARSPRESQQNLQRGFELPPLSEATSGSRLAGVSAILNARSPDDERHERRRKAPTLESPSASSLPPLAPPQFASSNQTYAPTPTHSSPAGLEHPPRRVLSPRSPSVKRVPSNSQAPYTSAPPSGHQTPYGQSPATRSGPPLYNTPLTATSSGFTFEAPRYQGSHGRGVSGTGPGQIKASVSPTTSYASQTSSTARYAPLPATTAPTSYDYPGDTASGPYSASERQHPVGIPISSSGGQNVYQMMTLETTSGRVQLPVDVQAASRVADEKRRRNAGASARFRQRRKEKEREASTTISRLEQQMKDLGDDLEFYRRERDYLASVLRQMPGGERHFPRPASPGRRRSSSAYSSAAGGYEENARYHDPDEGRNVRRRTSGMSLPLPPPAVMPAHPQNQGAMGQAGPYTPGWSTVYGGQQPPLQSPGHVPSSSHPRGPLPSPGLGPQHQQQYPSQPQPQQHQQQQHHHQQHQQQQHRQTQQQQPPPPSQPPSQNQPQGGPLPSILQAPPQTGPWNPYAHERR